MDENEQVDDQIQPPAPQAQEAAGPVASPDPDDPVVRAIVSTRPGSASPGWTLADKPTLADAQQRMQDFYRAHAVAERKPEEAAANWAQSFGDQVPFDAEAYGDWQKRADKETLLLHVRRQAEKDVPVTQASNVTFGPLGADLAKNVMYSQSKKRFDEGNPTGEDYGVIAHYELEHQRRNEFWQTGKAEVLGKPVDLGPTGGKFATVLAEAPGAMVALHAGGGLTSAAMPAKLAELTGVAGLAGRAGMAGVTNPAMFVPAWVEANKEAGRDAWDVRGLPGSLANSVLQAGVYEFSGALGSLAGKKLAPTAGNLLKAVGAGAAGPVTQALADGTSYMAGLSTRYGTFQDFAEGKYGDAWAGIARDVLMNGVMAGFHGPDALRSEMDAVRSKIDALAKSGLSRDVAARLILQEMNGVDRGVKPSPEKEADTAPVAQDRSGGVPGQEATQTPSEAVQEPGQAKIGEVSAESSPVSHPEPAKGPEVAPGAAKVAENQDSAPPGAKDGVPVPDATSIKNAVVDQERVARGLEPMMDPARRENASVWDAAMRRETADPGLTERMMSELEQKPRATTDEENALLLRRKVGLYHDYDTSFRALNEARKTGDPLAIVEAENQESGIRGQLDRMDKITKAVGTEWGRSGQFRQRAAMMDYSLAKMMADKITRRAPKNPIELAAAQKEAAEAHAKIKELEAKLVAAEHSARMERIEAGVGDIKSQVRDLTEQILQQDQESTASIYAAIADARKALKDVTVERPDNPTLKQLGRIDQQGRLHLDLSNPTTLRKFADHSGVPRFDAIVEEIAKAHPGILGEEAVSDTGETAADKLFDWLRHPPQKMSHNEARAEARRRIEDSGFDFGETPPKPTGRRQSAARQEVDAAWKDLLALGSPGRLFSNPGTEVLLRAGKLAKAYIKLGVAKVADFIEQVKAKAGSELDKEQVDVLTKAFNGAIADRDKSRRSAMIDRLKDRNDNSPEVSRAAKSLFKAETAANPDAPIAERVAAVHEQLKQALPDISLETTSDAIGGYGIFRPLSKDELSVKVRDEQGQLQQLGKLRDLEAGLPPKKSGPERREMSDEERALVQQVNQRKRELGIESVDAATELKSSLDAAKTRLRNQIVDMADQIAKGEERPKSEATRPSDAALEKLRTIRDALKEDFNRVFGEESRGMTDEQRLAMATAATERSIAEYERRIQEKDFDRKKGRKVSSEELEALQARRDALKEEFDALKDAANPKAKKSKEEIQNKRLRADYKRRIAEYKEKLAAGDFSKKAPEKIKADSATLDLKAELSQAQTEWQRGLRADERARETRTQKAIRIAGNALDFQRAWKLGGDVPPVLRQGAVFSVAHPFKAFKALYESAGAFKSELGAHRAIAELAERPNAQNGRYKRDMGLDVKDAHGQDEFLKSSWIEKVPLFSHLERWHSTFLTRVRADYYDALTAGLSRKGEPTAAEGRLIGNFVNVATGKGDLYGFQRSADSLSKVFLAPKWVASRFQFMLGQPLVRNLGEGANLRARMAVAKEYARFGVGLAAIYGLGKMIGFQVEDDPRSADFGEMRMGNVRLNPTASLTGGIRLVARLRTGEIKSTATGQIRPQGTGEVLGTELRNKLAPLPATALSVAEVTSGRKPGPGRPQTPADLLADAGLPLTLEDFVKACKDQGIPKGVAIGMWGSLGGGVKVHEK